MKYYFRFLAILFALSFCGSLSAEQIRIASQANHPPFNLKNATGNLVGFEVDIARALCDQMQVKCEFLVYEKSDIIGGLLENQFDAIFSSISMTEELKQKVAFSEPYYSNKLRFIAPIGSDIDVSSTGLAGKRLGAQSATTSADYLVKNLEDSATVKLYTKQEEAFSDLKDGELDAVLVDFYSAYSWLINPDNSKYDHLGDAIDINDRIAIAVRKQDTKLLNQFNQALRALLENGTYQYINRNYFPYSIH